MSRESLVQHDWFPTPLACTRELRRKYQIQGTCLEPCVGDGSIVRAFSSSRPGDGINLQLQTSWLTNDIDPSWDADYHTDATEPRCYSHSTLGRDVNWLITNPAFAIATGLLNAALPSWEADSIYNIALYLRLTYNEVLREDRVKRRIFATLPPTGLIFLPRVSHRRNGQGNWGSDSAACCWMIWCGDDRAVGQQRIEYAGPECLAELEGEKSDFRALIDHHLPPLKVEGP